MAKVPAIKGLAGRSAFFNANEVANEHRGWALGTFVTDQEGHPLTDEYEVKVTRLKAGTERTEWSVSPQGFMLTVVIEGKHEFTIAPDGPDGKLVTQVLGPGDALFLENTVPHRWRVLEDNLTATVRRLK